mgnify:CR=1 FL=1|jgi:hypothetical protein
MERFDYDLSSYSAIAGQMGRLNTVACIPVIANDSIEIDTTVALRLSPLRMPMTLDAKVDFCIFYDKYRFCYPDTWESMIKEGLNAETNITLPTQTVDRWTQYPLEYLAGNGRSTEIAEHYIKMYNRIWNHYYRIPNVSGEISEDYVIGEDVSPQGYHTPDTNQDGIVTYGELNTYLGSSTDSYFNRLYAFNSSINSSTQVQTQHLDALGQPLEWATNSTVDLQNQAKEERRYGRRCARLPQMWNTGLPADSYTNEAFAEVDIADDKFSLIDFAQARASLKTEIDRDWFTKRYRDHMSDTFGSSGVSIDADKRPELLLHDTHYLSGYDVDGTAGETFGSTTGKSAGMFQIKMPPKYFNEHGCVWIMALVRFPAIAQQDQHYLSNNTLDYKTISGDPRVIYNHQPIEFSVDDVFSGATNTTSIGMRAYADWYRWQPNNIHNDFHDEMLFNDSNSGDGYPFIDVTSIDFTDSNQIFYDAHQENGSNGYDSYFQSVRLGHWNMIARVNCQAKRIVPPASKSINAGVQ